MKRGRRLLTGVVLATLIVCLMIPVAGCGETPKRTVRLGEPFFDIQITPNPLLLDKSLTESPIAFTREDQVWTARGDGTEQKQLTDGFDASPAVSPDGKTIIYKHTDEDALSEYKEVCEETFPSPVPCPSTGIFAIPSTGGEAVRLTPASWLTRKGWTSLSGDDPSHSERIKRDCIEPSFSPNGKSICFLIRDLYEAIADPSNYYGVATMNSDGTGEPRVLSTVYCKEGYGPRVYSPRFSPDGSEIYVDYRDDQDSGIYKVPSMGGELTRVTDSSYSSFGISNSRNMIAAVQKRAYDSPTVRPNGIALMAMDGSGALEIYTAPSHPSPDLPDIASSYRIEPLSFSPSGKSIAFVYQEPNPADTHNPYPFIYVIPATGGIPTRILSNGHEPCF